MSSAHFFSISTCLISRKAYPKTDFMKYMDFDFDFDGKYQAKIGQNFIKYTLFCTTPLFSCDKQRMIIIIKIKWIFSDNFICLHRVQITFSGCGCHFCRISPRILMFRHTQNAQRLQATILSVNFCGMQGATRWPIRMRKFVCPGFLPDGGWGIPRAGWFSHTCT